MQHLHPSTSSSLPISSGAISGRRYRGQKGSALLVVLVFAAIVAIMLYRELPIAAFEAQRQKEQLLVSRGNEYKRGVKLFVRKIGRFPSSIEELESTNRMRFLRHKYVDPLTGKDDWRLIHAGPGGAIIDSKVQNASTQGKGANALGQGAVFAGFNNTFTGDQTLLGEAGPPNAALRQRAPATKNAATAQGDASGLPPIVNGSEGSSADPNAPQQPGQNGQVFNSQPPFDPATGQAIANGNPGANPQPTNVPGQLPQASPNGGFPAQGVQDVNAAGNGIGSVSQQLNNVNPKTPEQAQAGQVSAFNNNTPGNNTLGNGVNGQQNIAGLQGNGQIGAAGGIAGVASKAVGKSIKTVNDQTKYSLWEFYYDLRKDQNSGANGIPQNVNNGVNSNNGVNNSGFSNNNAAGQNNGNAQGQQSGFGTPPAFGPPNTQQQPPPQQSGFPTPPPPQ